MWHATLPRKKLRLMLERPQTRAPGAALPGDRRWTVVLTATEVEAGPLLERIPAAEGLVVATKTVYLGELGASAVAVAVTGCGIDQHRPSAHLPSAICLPAHRLWWCRRA